MTTSQPGGEHASVGSPVRTIDGKELGVVKEVQGKYIKIDAPHRSDFWLSVSTIRGSDEGVVNLGFDATAIEAFMLDEPGDAVTGPDSPDPVMDERVDARRRPGEQHARREDVVSGNDAGTSGRG